MPQEETATSQQTPSHYKLTIRALVLISHNLRGPKVKNEDSRSLLRNPCHVPAVCPRTSYLTSAGLTFSSGQWGW